MNQESLKKISELAQGIRAKEAEYNQIIQDKEKEFKEFNDKILVTLETYTGITASSHS